MGTCPRHHHVQCWSRCPWVDCWPWLTGTHFSVSSGSAVALMGVTVVQTSVILYSFVNKLRQGKTIAAATFEASLPACGQS